MSLREQPFDTPDETATESLERYDLTGRKLSKWRVDVREKVFAALKWIRGKLTSKRLPGTDETIGEKLKTSAGKAVEFVEAKATKDVVDNQLKVAQTQTEFQKQETEKLWQQLLHEQIRATRAQAIGQELDNEKKREEIYLRIEQLTRGKPPMRILQEGNEDAVVFGNVPLIESTPSEQPIQLANLELTSHTRKILEANGVQSVDDLLECTEQQLLAMNGVGPKTVQKVKRSLRRRGLELRDE